MVLFDRSYNVYCFLLVHDSVICIVNKSDLHSRTVSKILLLFCCVWIPVIRECNPGPFFQSRDFVNSSGIETWSFYMCCNSVIVVVLLVVSPVSHFVIIYYS